MPPLKQKRSIVGSYETTALVGILDSYPDDTSDQWFRHAFSGCDADIVLYIMSCVRQKRIVPRFLCLVNDPSIFPTCHVSSQAPKNVSSPRGTSDCEIKSKSCVFHLCACAFQLIQSIVFFGFWLFVIFDSHCLSIDQESQVVWR